MSQLNLLTGTGAAESSATIPAVRDLDGSFRAIIKVEGATLSTQPSDNAFLCAFGSGTDTKFDVTITPYGTDGNSILRVWIYEVSSSEYVVDVDFDPTGITAGEQYRITIDYTDGDPSSTTVSIWDDADGLVASATAGGFFQQSLRTATDSGVLYIGPLTNGLVPRIDAIAVLSGAGSGAPPEPDGGDAATLAYYAFADGAESTSEVSGDPGLTFTGTEDTDYEFVAGEWPTASATPVSQTMGANTEHLAAAEATHTVPAEHAESVAQEWQSPAEHLIEVIAEAVIPGEHRAAGITQGMAAHAEHLSSLGSTVSPSAEHIGAVSRSVTALTEHLLSESFTWTVPSEHLAAPSAVSQAVGMSAEHLAVVLGEALAASEHLVSISDELLAPAEHLDAAGLVSQTLTAPAEHLGDIEAALTGHAEHEARILATLSASAEHLLAVAASEVGSGEHLGAVEQSVVVLSEHLAVVVQTVTMHGEHTALGIVLYPIDSKTGPALRDYMFGPALED